MQGFKILRILLFTLILSNINYQFYWLCQIKFGHFSYELEDFIKLERN